MSYWNERFPKLILVGLIFISGMVGLFFGILGMFKLAEILSDTFSIDSELSKIIVMGSIGCIGFIIWDYWRFTR